MEISERKKRILAALVDDYIKTAEPVGSKAIAQNAGLGLSSATIRNELAELEALGLLEQPHTSAGRIPSPQGYRMYVNELMHQHKLSLEELESINSSLSQKVLQVDRLIAEVGRLAAQITNYPAYVLAAKAAVTVSRFDLIYVDPNTFIIVVLLSNNTVKNKLVHLPVSIEKTELDKLQTIFNMNFTRVSAEEITYVKVQTHERASGDTFGLVAAIAGFTIEILIEASSGDAYVVGTSQLLRQPEFRDPDKAHRIMNYLSDTENLLELPVPEEENSVKMLIGPENIAEELRDSSVIIAKYDAGDSLQGLVGIVGPTRMDYAKVSARLKSIASRIGAVLGGDDKAVNDLGREPPQIMSKGEEDLSETE